MWWSCRIAAARLIVPVARAATISRVRMMSMMMMMRDDERDDDRWFRCNLQCTLFTPISLASYLADHSNAPAAYVLNPSYGVK